MGPHFARAIQYLVVGKYVDLCSPQVSSEAFESPNNAAGLQFKRSPMPLRVERCMADIRDGFHGTVRLFLFKGGAKFAEVSVAEHVERT